MQSQVQAYNKPQLPLSIYYADAALQNVIIHLIHRFILYGIHFILVKQTQVFSCQLTAWRGAAGTIPTAHQRCTPWLAWCSGSYQCPCSSARKKKRPGVSQISLHQLFDVCRNAVIPCYPPFSKLATKATVLVPTPGSLAEAGLRAVYPDTSSVDLLLVKFSLEMCCRNTANLFWEQFAAILCSNSNVNLCAMESRISTFN